MEDVKHEATESKYKEKMEHGPGINKYTEEEKKEAIKKAAKRMK